MSLNKFTDTNVKEWMKIGCSEMNCGSMTVNDVIKMNIGTDIDFTNQAVTPSNPVIGETKIYTKTDSKLYSLDSSGVETIIGGDSGDITDLNTKTQNIDLLTTPLNTIHNGTLSATNFDTNALGPTGKLTTSYVADNTDVSKINLSPTTIDLVATNVLVNSLAVGDFRADGSIPMTGNLNMNTNTINNLIDPVLPQDGSTKNYADTQSVNNNYLLKTGGTMTGSISNFRTNDANVTIGLGARNATESTFIGNTSGATGSEKSVSVGYFSGSNAPVDVNALNVCVGHASNTDGTNNVCLGATCRAFGGNYSVMIGNQAGLNNINHECSVHIGRNSGFQNGGAICTSVGYQASLDGGGFDNCLTLSAGGAALNPTVADQINLKAGATKIIADSTGMTILGTALKPAITNTTDIGLTGTRFKDCYLTGSINSEGTINPSSANVKINGGCYVGNSDRPVMSGGWSMVNSATIANSVIETTLLNTSGAVGSLVVNAGQMKIGSTSGFTVSGLLQTYTNSQVITIRIKSGALTISTFPITITTSLAANSSFRIEGTLMIKTIGITGSIVSQISVYGGGSTAQSFNRNITATGTIDTTINNTFDITAQWTVADVDNTITSTIGVNHNIFQPM